MPAHVPADRVKLYAMQFSTSRSRAAPALSTRYEAPAVVPLSWTMHCRRNPALLDAAPLLVTHRPLWLFWLISNHSRPYLPLNPVGVAIVICRAADATRRAPVPAV